MFVACWLLLFVVSCISFVHLLCVVFVCRSLFVVVFLFGCSFWLLVVVCWWLVVGCCLMRGACLLFWWFVRVGCCLFVVGCWFLALGSWFMLPCWLFFPFLSLDGG